MEKFLHRLALVLLFASVFQFILCGATESAISTIFLVYGLLTLVLTLILEFASHYSAYKDNVKKIESFKATEKVDNNADK